MERLVAAEEARKAAEAAAAPALVKAPGGAIRFTILGLRKGQKDKEHMLYPFVLTAEGVSHPVELVRLGFIACLCVGGGVECVCVSVCVCVCVRERERERERAHACSN
jgi:hypothetical protein